MSIASLAASGITVIDTTVATIAWNNSSNMARRGEGLIAIF
ncbi:MAG: hypothetical protein Q7T29_10220 [Gallionella sp.]|nr:hypothetical protein [Gallionella sp.]